MSGSRAGGRVGRRPAGEMTAVRHARILALFDPTRRPGHVQPPEEAPMRGFPCPRLPLRPSGRRRAFPAAALVVLLLAAGPAACGAGHGLARYDFADRSLATVDLGTPRPMLLTDDYDVDAEQGALAAVLDAGSRAAKQVSARKARARLDSAASRLDMGERIASRVLQRGSRYLGARPVEESREADFLLELDVKDYGMDVRSGREARLFVVAEAILLERRTGREVWSTQVRGRDRLMPAVDGVDDASSDILTAGGLARISVDEFERILQGLADVSADAVTDQLREDLRDVRRDR